MKKKKSKYELGEPRYGSDGELTRTAKIERVLLKAGRPMTVAELEEAAGTNATREHLETRRKEGLIRRRREVVYFVPAAEEGHRR
jgi:hypothetical protein